MSERDGWTRVHFRFSPFFRRVGDFDWAIALPLESVDEFDLKAGDLILVHRKDGTKVPVELVDERYRTRRFGGASVWEFVNVEDDDCEDEDGEPSGTSMAALGESFSNN
ncbi:MAG: hypothetical protein F4Z40_00915 [Chloroflexi bacterium]|nr:hypothetical protein [Chloroflexota bacterium]